MAVIPINMARVSQNLRAFNLLETLRRNQVGLFRVQNQLATGQKLLAPSDDPLLAAAAGAIDRRLELIRQIDRNLSHVNNALTESESAMNDAVSLLMDVQNVASEAAGDTLSDDERAALVPVVQSILDQLVAVGNRPYLNAYLFGGSYGGGRPFELVGDGVIYSGDAARGYAIVDTDQTQDFFTLSGAEFFGAVSSGVHGAVDLDPALTGDTRICDLRGATGRGVSLGIVSISDGSQQVQIDLSGADTIGDILDKLNAEMPGSLQATLSGDGIQISSLGGPVLLTVQDAVGGQTARDLGIVADGLGGPVGGADLDPQLTLRTQLADLDGGAGLDLTNGLTIRNGSRSATLDFADAETMEDILNEINGAGVGVWARIAEDGRSIEVLNRISGTDLTIEENGGQLATALGVRSLNASTELAGLNDGLGIETVDGADLRFITADGTSIEVDVDGAQTLQDVIDRINAAGGGALTAGLAATGNGLSITDNTTGTETFRIERANLSPALDGLGLNVAASGSTLTGRDVNPVRTNSPFTALIELRNCLQGGDRGGITLAGQRLEDTLAKLQEVQGRMASHAKAMEARSRLAETEATGAQVMLSDVRDVDMTEVIVRFQQMQTALQANLTTSSAIMNLSLMDYLR
jgi:flagellar hook-associated protein 3 FlgL